MENILKDMGWLTLKDLRKEERFKLFSSEDLEKTCDELMSLEVLFRRKINGKKFYHRNSDLTETEAVAIVEKTESDGQPNPYLNLF